MAQLPAFSGAEGFGGTFTSTSPAGGWFSDASVYHVTTTADTIDPVTKKPAQGTLRGAFYDYTNPNSPKEGISNRIVVFDVGGTFDISANTLNIKTVKNIYIAGQTAPKPVTVYGNLTQITASNNTQNSNVILRYMTFRKGTGNGDDAITFKNGGAAAPSTNMIIDHVSASWSEDEVLSVANFNRNVTVQYTMMTDSLTNGHQYGSLIRPEVDSNVTFHHNLYANDKSRNPRMGSYNSTQLTFDFRDNVIYNWSERAGYAGGGSDSGSPTEKVNLNWVGNYAIVGPAALPATDPTVAVVKDIAGSNPLVFKAYQAANLIDSNKNAVLDGTDTGWNMFRVSNGAALPETDKTGTPFAVPPVTTTGAAEAYDQVLDYVGNFWWTRDNPTDPAHDPIARRIIDNVKYYTQPAGGVPAIAPIQAELDFVTDAVPLHRSSDWDSDGDGMPTVWELAHGLNPNLNTDFKLDLDNDGYVNLQEYLDEVGAFPAPTPLTFNGTSNTRYAVITNWKTSDFVSSDSLVHPGTNWQPSRFDEAQINGGTVVVDAVGQHANVLKIAADSGDNATLNVTGGWLKVESDVIIAAPGATAALNLTGGTLRTTTLSKGSGGSFSFTGGKLSVDTVNFSLVNNAGTLAPGDSIGATHTNSAAPKIGQTHVAGDLTLASGTLQIELASLASFDKLLVDGIATLGGNLAVSTLGGYTPVIGNSWQIITAGGISLQFDSISPGYTVQQQGNNLVLFFGNPILAGDYNNDGFVTADDYVVWRQVISSGGTLLNETATPGVTDQADYDAWRANFGAAGGPGSGAGVALSAIPEPTTVSLLTWAASVGYWWIGRRRTAKSRLRIFGSFLQE